jgi:hypothetical protein
MLSVFSLLQNALGLNIECLYCGHGKLWEGRDHEFEWEKLMKCAGGRDTRRISEEAQLSTNSLETCFSECSFSSFE